MLYLEYLEDKEVTVLREYGCVNTPKA